MMHWIISATTASQHALLSPPTSADYLPFPTSAPFLFYFDLVSSAPIAYRQLLTAWHRTCGYTSEENDSLPLATSTYL